jgi:hypothetical protein
MPFRERTAPRLDYTTMGRRNCHEPILQHINTSVIERLTVPRSKVEGRSIEG